MTEYSLHGDPQKVCRDFIEIRQQDRLVFRPVHNQSFQNKHKIRLVVKVKWIHYQIMV